MTSHTVQLASQIRHLLAKQHIAPCVRQGPSLLAGTGVFATTPIPRHKVVALYPGIYTPSLPPHCQQDSDDSIVHSSSMSYYLANQLSPAGIVVEDNAYILNLHAVGGYLDGHALVGRGRPLNANPSACGHLINHSATASNVKYVAFLWGDVLTGAEEGCEEMHDLPNERRQDGTPWYLEGDKIVRFPNAKDPERGHPLPLGGAAFITTAQVDEDHELLLNYRLRKPYPNWARHWYVGA